MERWEKNFVQLRQKDHVHKIVQVKKSTTKKYLCKGETVCVTRGTENKGHLVQTYVHSISCFFFFFFFHKCCSQFTLCTLKLH